VVRRVKQALKWIFRRLPFSVAVPLCRGNPSLAFYIPPGPRGVVVHRYLGEFTVHIDTHSDIERRMLSRSYEPDTLGVVARFVKPGMSVLDIGANVGAITFALAKAVGPTGHVVAFEPGPPIFAKLQQNLRINPGLTTVEAHMLGVADVEGKLMWQESQSDPGNASIHWIDTQRPVQSVEVTTIDAFTERANLAAIHFIKIDVEGMELKVLKGGAESIRRHRPAIYFESSLCDEEQRTAARGIEDLLGSMGYRLYKVGAKGAVVETRYPDFTFETLALPTQLPT
jgi:FkbM family methyltransferase